MKLLLFILLPISLIGQVSYSNSKMKVDANGCLEYQCGCGNFFSQKVVQIGTCDMTSKDTIRVPHNLTGNNIVSICAIVRNDDSTLFYQAMGHDGATTDFQVNYWSSTYVALKRSVTGTFNSTDFNSAINRGYLLIFYRR